MLSNPSKTGIALDAMPCMCILVGSVQYCTFFCHALRESTNRARALRHLTSGLGDTLSGASHDLGSGLVSCSAPCSVQPVATTAKSHLSQCRRLYIILGYWIVHVPSAFFFCLRFDHFVVFVSVLPGQASLEPNPFSTKSRLSRLSMPRII